MSKLILHDYNGFSIPQRELDSYVSLTQMAIPFNKKVNDYLRLKATEEYLQALSSDTGIPVSELIVIVKGNYSDKIEQGTWGHKLVALDFARWLNPSFSVWANTHILTLVETGTTSLKNDLSNMYIQEKATIDTLSLALDNIFMNLPIDKALVAGVKMNAIQSAVPHLANHIEPARQLLINSTGKEAKLLTVTELGKLMNPQLKAVDVNKLLITKGYQIKNPNKKGQKDLTYLPTDKAKDHCSITLATGSSTHTTYQQLRWYDTILSLI